MHDLSELRHVVGSRLKLARQNAGLTQAQVAALVALPRPSLSEAESGRRRVSAEELRVLAELYGVGISWLAGEGAATVNPQRDKLELAARELAKLKNEDVETLFNLLSAMRKERT